MLHGDGQPDTPPRAPALHQMLPLDDVDDRERIPSRIGAPQPLAARPASGVRDICTRSITPSYSEPSIAIQGGRLCEAAKYREKSCREDDPIMP